MKKSAKLLKLLAYVFWATLSGAEEDPCNYYAGLGVNKSKKQEKCNEDWSCIWDGALTGSQKCKTKTDRLGVRADVKALQVAVKAIPQLDARLTQFEQTLLLEVVQLKNRITALEEGNDKLYQQLQQVSGVGPRVTAVEARTKGVEQQVAALGPLPQKVAALGPLPQQVAKLETDVAALNPLGQQVPTIISDVQALQAANVPEIMVKGPFRAYSTKYATSTGDGVGYGNFEIPVLYYKPDSNFGESASSFCALTDYNNRAIQSLHGTDPICKVAAGQTSDSVGRSSYKQWGIYKKQDVADARVSCGATCLDGKDINFVGDFSFALRTSFDMTTDKPEAGKMFCSLTNVQLIGFFSAKHGETSECSLSKTSDAEWRFSPGTSNTNYRNPPSTTCEANCMQSTMFKDITVSKVLVARWPSAFTSNSIRENILEFSPNSYCALIKIYQDVVKEDETIYSSSCSLSVFKGMWRLQAVAPRLNNNASEVRCQAACVTW